MNVEHAVEMQMEEIKCWDVTAARTFDISHTSLIKVSASAGRSQGKWRPYEPFGTPRIWEMTVVYVRAYAGLILVREMYSLGMMSCCHQT